MFRYVVIALGIGVFCMTVFCRADTITQEGLAWDTVKSEGFGPVIGVEYPGTVAMTLEDRNTTISSTMWEYGASVVETELSENGEYMFVIYRAPSMVSYGYDSPPDNVWRKIYGCRNGKIKFLGEQRGTLRTRHEAIEFPPFCQDGSCD